MEWESCLNLGLTQCNTTWFLFVVTLRIADESNLRSNLEIVPFEKFDRYFAHYLSLIK